MTPQELEKFLEKHDLTDSEFATLVGVSDQAVKAWLLGNRKISMTTQKLIRYFDKYPKEMEMFT